MWGKALGVAIVCAGAAVYGTLRAHNHFAALEPNIVGACAPVIGIAGPEDLQADPANRRLFVSSYDKRSKEVARGSIHVLNIDDPLSASGWRDRTGGVPAAFLPIGLNYFAEGDLQRLFVVNAATNSIELFNVEPSGDLTHLETLAERRLSSPNDIVAIGPRDFLVTNDTWAGRSSLLGRLQFLGRTSTGSVLRYNGVSWAVVDEGLRFANGIAVSPDKKTLFVGESAGSAMKVYSRNQASGAFSASVRIALPGAVENINVDDQGRVLVATNPKPLTIARHRQTSDAMSPSLVIGFDGFAAGGAFSEGAVPQPEPLFRSDGEMLSAATSADMIGSTLFIGTLADDRFLICQGAS